MTVNDLITAALRRLRVISGSDPASGDDLNDALLRFNDWIDDLKTQDFLDLFQKRVAWPLVSSKVKYTIGPGPGTDIVTDLPMSAADIHNIGYVTLATQPPTETSLGPPLSDDAWAAIPNKFVSAAFPYYWFFTADPTGALYPYPIPTQPGLLGVMYVGSKLQEVTINTVLTLPPGYRRFLRDGLALELAPEFHVSDQGVLGLLHASVEEARQNIKRKKRRPMQVLQGPEYFGMGDTSNIYMGP